MTPPKGVHPSDLTPREQAHVRMSLRFLHAKFGSWEQLAKVLGFKADSLRHDKPVSVRLAFRVARLVDVPIDDVLAGKFPSPGVCPYCGHVAETPGKEEAPM